jgi:hypothetical protein
VLQSGYPNAIDVVVAGGATANTEEAAQQRAEQISVFKVAFILLFVATF